MNITKHLLLFSFAALLAFASCKPDDPEPDPVLGCMDPTSLNYNASATEDDGSCEYPKKYMPMDDGNYWYLSDSVTIPFLGGALITASFNQTGDTVMNGTTYKLQHEVVNASGIGDIQNSTFAYRMESTGKVYRIEVGDSVEHLFLTYPLELGTTWYDTPAQDAYYNEVFAYTIVTVPVGSFSNVVAVHVNDLAQGTIVDFYFAQDKGLIRVDMDYDVAGTPLHIQMELDSYHVN